ncbi:MAG: MmcQ/YjbR family DNA-binding protein [Chitinophagaceae bacterium]|nr:MAG: MmcQ/YjbR family DNA-binding protein [Chitinophagaceae bacterium]
MVSMAKFKEIALSFPEATEHPHFEKTSFRVNKKIFATLNITGKQGCVKLSEAEQDVFSLNREVIFPIPNKWGKQGWTFINLDKVREELLIDALTTSYCHVAPKKLADQLR